MQSLYILHLDRHHLGDDLFLKSLAQQYASSQGESPASILVHGSGEKVERTLEAQGYFPERTEGLLDVETDEQRRLVERAVREVNQEIVATLTDEVVSTVGIQGVDRGLFRVGEDHPLQVANAGWVSALIKQHVVPVVSALVESRDTDHVREVPTADAVLALARALDASFDPVVCVFTTAETAGLQGGDGTVLDEVTIEAVPEDHVPEPWAIRKLADSDFPLLATNLDGLFAGGEPQGTVIRQPS